MSMANFNAHIYAIQNIIYRGVPSDDKRLSNRLIGHYLTMARNLLVKRKLDKERFISPDNYQSICIPLEETNYANCPECNVPDFGCYLLKSTIQIPKSIGTRWGFTYMIRDIHGNIIPQYTFTNKKYSKYSLTSQQSPIGWFTINNYLYILNTKSLKLVLLEAIFENPEEISKLEICGDGGNNAPCIDVKSREIFPIDGDLIYPMYEMTIKMMGFAREMPSDDLGNAREVEIREKLE